MNALRWVLLSAALLSCPGCVTTEDKPPPAPKHAVAEDGNDSATLRITPCFGDCPADELTVWRDGRAVFAGNDHGCLVGRYAASPAAARVKAVFAAIAQADLPRPPERTRTSTMGVVDHSRRELEVRTGGHRVRVRISMGGKAPPHLVPVEDAFRDLKDGSEWRQADAAKAPKTCPAMAPRPAG